MEQATPSSSHPAAFRPDIEGLRAVAVVLVLLYHAGFLDGGFIGVDVFFVLSGFLITGLLLRELHGTGTVSLTAFWGRRARRLLPAAGLVVLATLVASHFLLDGLSQGDVAHDAIAASLFVANVRFMVVGTDYLASQLPPSPLLHYWSLSAEEQFYVVWPLTLLLVHRVLHLSRRSLAALVGVLWVASLAACVALTTDSQPWAFFMLPTRAWELLTGAVLALAGRSLLPRGVRSALGWLGVAAVVASGIAFGAGTAFPGAAALVPVVGTMLVVNAGAGLTHGPAALLRLAPLQWIGARSYVLYLWHFPILILAERHWGPLPAGTRAALLGLAVVLAAVTHVLVENPIRHSPALAAVPGRSLMMGAFVVLLGVGGAMVLQENPPRLDAGVDAAAPSVVTLAPTTTAVATSTSEGSTTTAAGPTTTPAPTTTAPRVRPDDASKDNPPELQALIDANLAQLEAGVATTKVPANLDPSLGTARKDLPPVYSNGCILDVGQNQPRDCVYGDPNGAITIVLFGDSHAAEWMPAMDQVSRANGWRLVVHTKKACPYTDIPTEKDPSGNDCGAWKKKVIERIGALHPALVVVSSYRYKQVGSAAGRSPDQVWKEGADRTIAQLVPLADHVLILGDSATPKGDPPSCLAGSVSNVPRCMETRAGATRPARLGVEREVALARGADFIPTSDWMCTDTACPVIVGNILMYRDVSHLTATASRFFAPFIEAALRHAMS